MVSFRPWILGRGKDGITAPSRHLLEGHTFHHPPGGRGDLLSPTNSFFRGRSEGDLACTCTKTAWSSSCLDAEGPLKCLNSTRINLLPLQATSHDLDIQPYRKAPMDLDTYLSDFKRSDEWEIVANESKRIATPREEGEMLVFSRRTTLRWIQLFVRKLDSELTNPEGAWVAWRIQIRWPKRDFNKETKPGVEIYPDATLFWTLHGNLLCQIFVNAEAAARIQSLPVDGSLCGTWRNEYSRLRSARWKTRQAFIR